jgi:hypothetical protein
MIHGRGAAIFDNRLLESLPVGKTLLRRWIRETNPATQIQIASKKLPEIISRLSLSRIRIEGKTRRRRFLTKAGLANIKKMAENIHRFEGLIEQVRTKFRGKIYRDHLNHMIRTALLAAYLADQIGLSKRMKNDVVIAALLHDIAYPVQESRQILRSVVGSLGKGYSILRFGEISEASSRTPPECLPELAERTGLPYQELHRQIFNEHNHGAVAAAEFLLCCRRCSQRALGIAAAICMHDSSIDVEIKYSDNRLGVLLIIADELQDWGRPVSKPDGSQSVSLEEIHPFKVSSFPSSGSPDEGPGQPVRKKLICGLKYQEATFPGLDVIYSKYQNLRRLVLKEMPLAFQIKIPISEYSHSLEALLPYYRLIQVLPKVRSPWRINGLELSDSELVERIGLERDEVTKARKVLFAIQKEPSRFDESPWRLWRFGESHNYLIIKDWPHLFELVTEREHFQLKLSYKSSKQTKVDGELVRVNEPPLPRHQPRIITPIQTVLRLLQIERSYWKPLPPANVYWFIPSN